MKFNATKIDKGNLFDLLETFISSDELIEIRYTETIDSFLAACVFYKFFEKRQKQDNLIFKESFACVPVCSKKLKNEIKTKYAIFINFLDPEKISDDWFIKDDVTIAFFNYDGFKINQKEIEIQTTISFTYCFFSLIRKEKEAMNLPMSFMDVMGAFDLSDEVLNKDTQSFNFKIFSHLFSLAINEPIDFKESGLQGLKNIIKNVEKVSKIFFQTNIDEKEAMEYLSRQTSIFTKARDIMMKKSFVFTNSDICYALINTSEEEKNNVLASIDYLDLVKKMKIEVFIFYEITDKGCLVNACDISAQGKNNLLKLFHKYEPNGVENNINFKIKNSEKLSLFYKEETWFDRLKKWFKK